uniref:Uncharacterized protein n=1 Tax=Pseudomonas aeruginosa TaxID=287 RepID=P72167_PSEAI|nr:unknown [Pseudomonas aeruginosa]
MSFEAHRPASIGSLVLAGHADPLRARSRRTAPARPVPRRGALSRRLGRCGRLAAVRESLQPPARYRSRSDIALALAQPLPRLRLPAPLRTSATDHQRQPATPAAPALRTNGQAGPGAVDELRSPATRKPR